MNSEGEAVLRFRFAVNADGTGCYAWLNPVEQWGIEAAGWNNAEHVEISDSTRRWENEENGVHLNIAAKSARFVQDGRVTNGRFMD